MLFSSFFFVMVFLPLSLFLYFLFSKISSRHGLWMLLLLSSIFYSWAKPVCLLLIFFSIAFNFYLAQKISSTKSKNLFILSLAANILLLVVFKYSNFLVENINVLFSLNIPRSDIPLPLAISFFTFQQIGFLVEVYREKNPLPGFVEYANYVTFFPQLIAGPIVKHTDYLPQLNKQSIYSFSIRNLSIGFTIFILGLFKKTILADNAGTLADLIFNLARDHVTPNWIEAWMGIFAYSFQIYFDFSGYSDMAIGLARMFNIYLPCNFLSPYKATSIIEFWRRWHISLSTFLKEHIYIPLGGNRKGSFSRYKNLFLTMLIGGLWHGASWTFVIWGGLHGVYLILNHLMRKMTLPNVERWVFLKRVVVFSLISLTWVFFRAEKIEDALLLLRAATDIRNFSLPKLAVEFLGNWGLVIPFKGPFHLSFDTLSYAISLLPCLFFVSFFMPNVYEWMAYFKPAKDFTKTSSRESHWFKRLCWKPTLAYGVFIVILSVMAFGSINRENEFIYFRF